MPARADDALPWGSPSLIPRHILLHGIGYVSSLKTNRTANYSTIISNSSRSSITLGFNLSIQVSLAHGLDMILSLGLLPAVVRQGHGLDMRLAGI